MKPLILAALLALPGAAQSQTAGLLERANRVTLPALKLMSGEPVSEEPLRLKSGTYYILEVVSDGSAELALEGAGFFRAIWVNEVVINDIEIRPSGLHSFEFDDEGTLEMSFVAIKPGSYSLSVPGSTGASQRVEITIE
ncbi:hypothetical protein [Pseudotabrizicola algicola]|uniref:MSP domain-containing protein n=1 Tax=Pseudotabrizicola algicola TaxID=2709381 RepID=A0A6B3RT51_9RHOB|nr:hypothetical protein [Pseudotabrizicola algicola]NEX47938.1 hypothetical protein [Pseudotabrizicola algicola]